MYTVSDLWRTLIARDGHWFETKIIIGSPNSNIGNEVGKDKLRDISVTSSAFSGNTPSAGACLSSELEVTMDEPGWSVPRMAKVRPYIRVTDGIQTSEWVPQGVYYVDTREYTKNDDGIDLMKFHCYDGMMKTEQDYSGTNMNWPQTDRNIVNEIAGFLGVGVDLRTWDIINKNYQFGMPVGYSYREVLGRIAAAYAGNWVMNYDGNLLLIAIGNVIPETNYLINELGFTITFGGDRILV